MGNTLNMVEEFINDMVSESSYLETPTMAKGSNETTTVSEMRKVKTVVVHENNNDGIKRADTGLEPNNMVPTSWKKGKDGFTNGLIIMKCGIITPIHLQKGMNWGLTHIYKWWQRFQTYQKQT